MDELYSVMVSSLEIRKLPSIASKINLKRDTVVKSLDHTRQYKKEPWLLVSTIKEPITQGYVPKKYLSKIN